MTIKDFIPMKRSSEGDFRVVSPVVNIEEKETEIMLYAEMPGIEKDALAVEVHGDEMTISAKRTSEVPKGYTSYLQERIPVEYRRVFSLGNQIDKNNISAQYENGIVTIVLKKSESAYPKKITVT
ncbi:Hsp20/alpha crystallin family protein [Candidatus Omnitrophota bacterium]